MDVNSILHGNTTPARFLGVLGQEVDLDLSNNNDRKRFDRALQRHFKTIIGLECALRQIELKGSVKDRGCGGELQYHHLEPPVFAVGSYRLPGTHRKRLRKISVLLAEMSKCSLVCARHHKQIHTCKRFDELTVRNGQF